MVRGLGLLGLLSARSLSRPRSGLGLCGSEGATKRALGLWLSQFGFLRKRLLKLCSLLQSLEDVFVVLMLLDSIDVLQGQVEHEVPKKREGLQVPEGFLWDLASERADGQVASDKHCIG